MADIIKMSFPANTAYISVVRLAASGIAGSLEYTLDEIEDLKSCISEACLLVLYGQECDSLFIETRVSDDIKITVNAVDAKPAKEGEFADFSEEISRIMIEALSDESDFNEVDGILQSVSFVKKHHDRTAGGV